MRLTQASLGHIIEPSAENERFRQENQCRNYSGVSSGKIQKKERKASACPRRACHQHPNLTRTANARGPYKNSSIVAVRASGWRQSSPKRGCSFSLPSDVHCKLRVAKRWERPQFGNSSRSRHNNPVSCRGPGRRVFLTLQITRADCKLLAGGVMVAK